MRRQFWQKFLAITLALMMATSLGLGSGALHARADGAVAENETKTVEGDVDYASAYANEGETTVLTVIGEVKSETGGNVYADADDGGSVTLTTGNVNVSQEDETDYFVAVTGDTATGSEVNVTVGDITSSGIGFHGSNRGGTLTAETGAITSGSNGVDVYTEEQYHWEELTAEAYAAVATGTPTSTWTNEPPENIVPGSRYQIQGECYQAEDGTWYYHYIYNDGSESYHKQWYTPTTGSTEVEIGGSVTAVNERDNYWINGVTASANSEDQVVAVTVDGDVTVDNKAENGGAEGVRVSTDFSDEEEGTASIVVDGDITVSGNGSVYGVEVSTDDGNVSAVAGDVTTSGNYGSGARVNADGGVASLITEDINVTTQGWGNGVEATLEGDGVVTAVTEDITVTSGNSSATAASLRIYDDEDEDTAGGVATLSTGDITSNGSGVGVSNSNGTASVTVGDIDAEDAAARIYGLEGAETTFTAGALTSENSNGMSVDNTSGTMDITVGNINAVYTAASINGYEDAETTFTAGTLTSTDSDGLYIYNYGGDTTATTGAISADNYGVYISTQDESNWEDLTAEEFSDVATGDPSETWSYSPGPGGPGSLYRTKAEVFRAADGVTYYHYFYNDGTETYSKQWYTPMSGSVEATVNGNVTVTKEGENFNWANGVYANTGSDKQTVSVTVNGNVTVDNQNAKGGAYGVRASVGDEKSGSVDLSVAGDITVTSTASASGVEVQGDDGSAVASVGDVTVSGQSGTAARVSVEDGTAALIAGDISMTSTNWGNALDVDVYGDGTATATAGDVTYVGNSGYAVSVSLSANHPGMDEEEKDGSAALIVGNVISDANGVDIDNYNGTAEITVGNVTADYNALNVYGSTDTTTTVKAGTLTNDDGTALYVSNHDADMTVTAGDVLAGVNHTEGYSSSGVQVYSNGSGDTAVTVGDIAAETAYGGTGLGAELWGDGTMTVTAGDVDVKVEEVESGYYYGTGVNVNIGTYYNGEDEDIGGGTVTLTAGDVTSEYVGVDVYNRAGIANVTVGDISSKDTGAYVNVSEQGKSTFTAGDITSAESYGLNTNNNGGTLNATVGAVSGADGVSVSGDRAGDWEWMPGFMVDELGLGDPDWTDVYEDEEGYVRYTDYWYGDDVEYIGYRYGEGEGYGDLEKVTYTDVEGTSTVQVDGNIQAKGTDWTTGADISINSAKQEGSLTVDGNITVESAENSARGANVYSSRSGEAELDIDGNVSATGATWTNGLGVYAGEDGTSFAMVEGDISATSTDELAVGVQMNAYTGGTAEAVIAGDITATGDSSDGIETFNNEGTLILTVVGDVTANDTGIEMNSGNRIAEYLEGTITVDESELTYYGMDKDGEYAWKEYVHKDGDKEIHYDENGNQWILTSPEGEKESVSNIEIIGDVTGTNEAAIFNLQSENAKMDVIVDGTMSGEENGVVLKSETIAENITLTVWEIKPNEDGAVAARETGIWTEDADGKWDTTTVEDEEFEKQIQYIIRVQQPDKGSLDTEGTKDYEGYKVANEGDTVTLKVNIPSGYRLKDAFNGTDTKVQLAKDESGNYYLVVPRGGAVTLSVTLERIPQKQKSDEEITEAVEEAIANIETSDNTNTTSSGTTTKVEVKTNAEGKKTVVLTPVDTTPVTTETPATTETAAETTTETGAETGAETGTETADETGTEAAEEATEPAAAPEVSQVTVSSELITEVKKANVDSVAVSSKSEAAQVVLKPAAIEKVMKENNSAYLVIDIDEGTQKVEEAVETSVPDGFKAVEGAVFVQVKLIDKEGDSKTLGANENIKVSLNIEYTEGMQFVYVGSDGEPVTVEAVWVEATEDVPGHWEVPYMGVGSYIPVLPE